MLVTHCTRAIPDKLAMLAGSESIRYNELWTLFLVPSTLVCQEIEQVVKRTCRSSVLYEQRGSLGREGREQKSFTHSCLEELQHRELNELVTNRGQALADLHCTNSTARLSLIAHVQYPTSSLRLQVAKVFAKTNCGPFPRPEYLGVPRNRTGR